jgi:neurofibromin 1
MFVDAIVGSVAKIPPELRHICYILYSNVQTKFPTATRNSLSGLIFLRVVTPAILSPQSLGLIGKKKKQ